MAPTSTTHTENVLSPALVDSNGWTPRHSALPGQEASGVCLDSDGRLVRNDLVMPGVRPSANKAEQKCTYTRTLLSGCPVWKPRMVVWGSPARTPRQEGPGIILEHPGPWPCARLFATDCSHGAEKNRAHRTCPSDDLGLSWLFHPKRSSRVLQTSRGFSWFLGSPGGHLGNHLLQLLHRLKARMCSVQI